MYGNLHEVFKVARPSCFERALRCNVDGKRIAKLGAFSCLLLLFLSSDALAQSAQTSVTITVSALDVLIQVKPNHPSTDLSFLDSSGAAVGLGNRIVQVRGTDSAGTLTVAARRAPGIYQFGQPASTITYKIHLDGLRTNDAAQVSWLTSNCGLLMLEDLLPQQINSDGSMIDVRFELPSGWSIQSTVPTKSTGVYSLDKPSKAVFLIGTSLKSSSKTPESSWPVLVTMDCIPPTS